PDLARGSGIEAAFVSWGIGASNGQGSSILDTTGPFSLRFVLRVHSLIRNGHHGIALFNQERQLIWGTAADNLRLPPGEHELCYSFPTLPVRPGPYTWLVSLYDENELLDAWECAPEMIVATDPVSHKRDEWSG